MKEVAPPVGTYNDPRCALEVLKRTTGAKKSPFGINAERFTPNQKKTPGQYGSGQCVCDFVCVCVPVRQSLLFKVVFLFDVLQMQSRDL